jgi:hypothetical protein
MPRLKWYEGRDSVDIRKRIFLGQKTKMNHHPEVERCELERMFNVKFI